MITKIKTIGELKNFVEENEALFRKKRCYAFRGEMGAGKTTFIQSILENNGVRSFQGSPTYAIINEYETADGTCCYHIDCYRLKSDFEAFDLGLEELLSEKNLIFIEWAEKIEKFLPPDTIWIDLRVSNDQIRTIEIANENRS